MEAWQTRDYGREGKAVSMSRKALGDFLYHLLRHKGKITSTFAMQPQMDRTYVQFAILLPEGKKESFEEASGFTLEPIATLSLS
jgi:hypothetical protein